MKKYISGLLAGIIIATSLTTFAAVQLKVVPNPYPIFINNSKANVQGYNINGSTYLKLSDLKVAGIDAGYNKDKKQIEVKSDAGLTDNNSNSTGNKQNPIFLYEGDVKDTTYKKYTAIEYNKNTYVNQVECDKSGITLKHSIKQKNYVLLKNGLEILKTLDSSPTYFVVYEGQLYFNTSFLGEYLEN